MDANEAWKQGLIEVVGNLADSIQALHEERVALKEEQVALKEDLVKQSATIRDVKQQVEAGVPYWRPISTHSARATHSRSVPDT